MLKLLFTFFLATNAFLLVSTVDDPDPTSPGEEPADCSDAIDLMLQNGNAALTGKFLYEAVTMKPKENVIMSAFSLITPLLQLAFNGQEDTRDQILLAVNIPDQPSIKCIFPKLINNLRAEQDVVLNLANKILATDVYRLSEKFINDAKNIFDAEPESVNFVNGKATADKINEWASWLRPFNKRNTMNRTFHIDDDKSVDIPTMYQENFFKYGENNELDCKLLQMPYKGNFSFVIFLPNKIDGLLNLVEKLLDPTVFYSAYNNIVSQKVKVYIPKMEIESTWDLIPLMKSVGITDVVDKFKSNITGILETFEPLYVSSARQKTFIDVNEDGTEAAAANVVSISALTAVMNPRPVPVFKADRPFPFYVMNKKNILFSGIFATN